MADVAEELVAGQRVAGEMKLTRKMVRGLRICWLCVSIIACLPGVGNGQSGPEQGGTEVQVWTSAGHSVPGGRGKTGIWNAGLRYGWVLTDVHLPGLLRGRFEYAVDAVPAYLIFQPANTAYGVGLNPLNLKWNFAAHGRISPYLELSGGTLFTTHTVPPGTSGVNFTSGAALGTHFLGDTRAWSLEARYLHISNAGLSDPNPGINTFEVRIGIGKFRR
jgi:Lipid A 3-O-deacylase (PagL)